MENLHEISAHRRNLWDKMTTMEIHGSTLEWTWFCLKCRVKQEQATSRILSKEPDIQVSCPMFQFESVRWGRRTLVREAMFPGYFFARFDYQLMHRKVAYSQGVSQIVRFGGIPATIPDQVIETMQALLHSSEMDAISVPIELGKEVTLADGAFCGLRAVVTRVMPGRQRIAVLLDLLGAAREVEVGVNAVIPDSAHPLK